MTDIISNMQQEKDEDLAGAYKLISETIAELETRRLALKVELIKRLKEAGRDSREAGRYVIQTFPIVTFKTTPEEAERYGAVITQKKVDTDILRKLYQAGKQDIPGLTIRDELRINTVEEEKTA